MRKMVIVLGSLCAALVASLVGIMDYSTAVGNSLSVESAPAFTSELTEPVYVDEATEVQPETVVEAQPAETLEEPHNNVDINQETETLSEPVYEELSESVAVEPVSCESALPDWSTFKSDGVWYDDQYRYTYYSSRVLYHYRTSEWTPNEYGIYTDSDGYIVVASSDYPEGTLLETSKFGTVKVYDCGCASGTLDVYVNW